MSKTATIYHRDGREKTVDIHDASRMAGAGQAGAGRDWSFVKPPPPGWEREVQKYRATRDLRPAERARYRLEPPFENVLDSSIWQYAEREIKAGEIIDTKAWPHSSFLAINYGAERVLEFFNSQMKSRMTTSPWFGDSLRLDNGLIGPGITQPVVQQLQPMDLRTAS